MPKYPLLLLALFVALAVPALSFSPVQVASSLCSFPSPRSLQQQQQQQRQGRSFHNHKKDFPRCPSSSSGASTLLGYKNYREMQVDIDFPWASLLDEEDLTTTNNDSAMHYYNNNNNKRRILDSWRTRMRRCWHRIMVKVWQWQQSLRTLLETYTIYVLECENGKYYVGSTFDWRRRVQQHDQGQGAAWTRLHKPIQLAFTYKRVPAQYYLGMEAKITAEWMLKYGVNNVRGAMFDETRTYTLDDVDKLTGFLGHYLDLSYPHVEAVLQQSLPPPDATTASRPKTRRRKQKSQKQQGRRTRQPTDQDICFKCGQQGHWAVNCTNVLPEQCISICEFGILPFFE